MRTRPSTVSFLFAFLCLTFITEGRLTSPTRTSKNNLSASEPDEFSRDVVPSEPERFSTDVVSSKCEHPPFLPPFALPDAEAFNVISSCPFNLHRNITGNDADGCFPIYSVSGWDYPDSISYRVYESNSGVESPLVLKKKSTFATSEEFGIISTADASDLGECMARMNYKVEGFNGMLSGEKDKVGLAAIAISFNENDKETTMLLPIGGCEIYSRQSVSPKKIEDSCSIRPNGIEKNECFERCYTSIEFNYVNELDKLTANRSKRISKNYENEDGVVGKLLTARAVQLSTAFARCKCKHGEQDLGQCFVRLFLDTLVSENEDRFQADEAFDQHIDEVETWFQDSQNLLCDSSATAAVNCRDEC